MTVRLKADSGFVVAHSLRDNPRPLRGSRRVSPIPSRTLPVVGIRSERTVSPGHSFRVSYLFIFLWFVVASAETFDYIIIKSPPTLTIYNQFEQPLSHSEKAALVPAVPMRIITKDGRLGDQITRAMQCQYQQKTYYILQDERGVIPVEKKLFQMYKGCAAVDDTVEIVKTGTVRLFESPDNTGPSIAMPKDALLILLFRYKSALYVQQLRPDKRFGWTRASIGRDVLHRTVTTSSNEASMTPNFFDRLNERIEYANRTYAMVFEAFNRATGQQKSIPRWKPIVGPQRSGWILSSPYDRTGELDESTTALVEDLRDICIGKSLFIAYEMGKINVGSKAP